MNGVGDAHAAALMQQQQQQHVQRQQGMSSFAGEQGSSKPRMPGLPPTPPPPQQQQRAGAGDVCMVDVDPRGGGGKAAHRRSRSDVPFGYFQAASSSLLPPPKVEAGCWSGGAHTGAADADDLFNSYLNLDGLDGGLNSSDERHGGDDGDSSENESEEGATGADSRAGIRLWSDGGLKRAAAAEPAAPMARHARSLSMDSLIGKFNFAAGGTAAANGVIPGPNRFSLEFGSGEFTPAEMKKIMADEKLAEMALADPKRVKRVLANRQSAARSKERKMRYIAELEHKVQILQTEATTLSAQLTLLQRDSAGIATQNNELKFRLQAMEQQAQLRDALNEALTAEVQRLKLATAELGDSCSSNNLAHQMQLNVQDQMFQLQQQQQQQQQGTPIPFYQLQQPHQNGAGKNHESKE
ncbi:hypothetical protein EJB05_08175, partial [Eragrostis curvula]